VRGRPGLALVGVVLFAAGCGGGSKQTVTVTVPQVTTSSESTTSTEPSGASTDVHVEQTKITYLPEQIGGHYHDILVLLRNDSDKAAVDISGQISVYDGSRLVKTIDPTPVTILAHSRNAWVETLVNLPKALPHGRLKAYVAPVQFEPGGSPVTISRVRYKAARPSQYENCSVSGLIQNQFTEPQQFFRLVVVGFQGSKLATGDEEFPADTLYPGRPTTFDHSFVSPAECPRGITSVAVYPDLSADQLVHDD
jgi:hypothetical protein